ncbi:MAG TPA: hypothetical protein VMQ51_19275 [Candidatus Binatia bacterium]|nr:hypothetical protein [Candidatus Binatia bacterium]
MLEAVMNAHTVSYPSLQRRLIADRRARAFFLPRTTQHLRRSSLLLEIGRAAVALSAATAWALLLLLAA